MKKETQNLIGLCVAGLVVASLVLGYFVFAPTLVFRISKVTIGTKGLGGLYTWTCDLTYSNVGFNDLIISGSYEVNFDGGLRGLLLQPTFSLRHGETTSWRITANPNTINPSPKNSYTFVCEIFASLTVNNAPRTLTARYVC
jgi:hypothetical protein